MPRKRITISDATTAKVRAAVLDATHPQTVAQVRASSGVSDQTCRAVLTELVERDTLMVDRNYSPIRYRPRGEVGAHEEVWSTIYTLILDRCGGDRMKTETADELAAYLMQMIEATGAQAQDALIDETKQVESRKRK